VIGSDNKATQRAVKLGGTVGSEVLIQEGIKTGDRIVVEGLQKVREGATVKAMTAAEVLQAAEKAEKASKE
jgi:hypothetical protein